MRSFERLGYIRLGGERSVKEWSTCDHWQTLTLTHIIHTHTFQSAALSLLFTPDSQNWSRKASWDSPSAAKVSKASSWPNMNTPEYILAWLSMDEPLIGLWTREASCSLALSFSFRMLPLLFSHPDARGEVREHVCTSVCAQRCVVAHMRKPVEGYLCFLIFFIVFDVLSWSSRS